MVHSNSQVLKFTLTTVAFVMLLTASITGVKATADNTPLNSEVTEYQAADPAHSILLRRGLIDTRARADLDTAATDMAWLEGTISTASRADEKQIRIIQFAGAIKPEWLERL